MGVIQGNKTPVILATLYGNQDEALNGKSLLEQAISDHVIYAFWQAKLKFKFILPTLLSNNYDTPEILRIIPAFCCNKL